MTAGRKGHRIVDIDPTRRAQLDAGTIEAATLTECLSVDFAALLPCAVPAIGEQAVETMRRAAAEGVIRRMALAAHLVLDHGGVPVCDALRDHPSDTVRGWACFMVGAVEDIPLADRLHLIRPLADDPHFGVREWSWMAVRGHIAAELDDAIDLLAGWAAERSEYLRRFASEATRPRGVWCSHIRALRQAPERALPILEPLRSDPAAYVQDSVGNWLNDAGKDRPDWVRSLCARWMAEGTAAATGRICKRGLRSIDRPR